MDKEEQEIVDLLSAQTLNDYLKFQFLTDELTINFIKSSKVIFIMRGLPGSGKSTITRAIQSKYGGDVVVCSADFYFTDKLTGEYKFDENKLDVAHKSAHHAAEEACKNSRSPIIIDNTNVRYWEMKPYLSYAHAYNYIVIVCEPNTPWKFDINHLATKNTHNVRKDVLQKKLKDYETIVPIYFGWFLNEIESNLIKTKAFEVLDKCLTHCTQLDYDLRRSNKTAISNKLIFKQKSSILHCTSKFCGKFKYTSPEFTRYVYKSSFSTNIFKQFFLKIIGFTITNRTIGAQVDLTDDLVKCDLWDNDTSEEQINDMIEEVLENKSKQKSKKTNSLKPNSLSSISRAHLTIALANNIHAVQTGLDQLLILNLMKLASGDSGDMVSNIEHLDCDDLEISYLGKCLCYIKLKEPIIVNSIFSLGFF